jgi:hypothetical protein
MGVKDNHVLPSERLADKCLTMPIGTTATGQTALEVDELRPGFNFEIRKVEVHATGVTATASVNVLIGSTTALASAITPVAGDVVQGTLSTTMAARRGNSTDNIVVQYTTNGSGVITNGKARVWIRPFPMNGEVMPLAGL